MALHPDNIGQAFSDALLENVLDYLELKDLLISAVAVNRSWREQVINHRTYWGDLALLEDGASELGSTRLFLLRLSRSEGRPVSVTVTLANPSPVLHDIARHISHIRRLSLCTDLSSSNDVLQAFRRSSAPILAHLTFQFRTKLTADAPAIDMMPIDLFASSAPALAKIDLTNINLPAQAPFPSCILRASSLSFRSTSMVESSRAFPNVLEHLPHLRKLSLGEGIILADPAFFEESAWEGVEEFSFWDGARAFELPLSSVRCVRLYCPYYADGILRFAATLSGPLSVAFPLMPDLGDEEAYVDGAYPNVTFCLRPLASDSHIERWVETWLPIPDLALFPFHAFAALQRPVLTGCITRLVLSIANWDHFFALRYLHDLPVLEELVLNLVYWPPHVIWLAPDPEAKLVCPRLQRLVLRKQRKSFPPIVDVKDVAKFVECLEDKRADGLRGVCNIFSSDHHMSALAFTPEGAPVFPDLLLADVLDYLDLDDLLLFAMPVSKYWRWSVINHRTYWHNIELIDDGPEWQPGLDSVDLFLLRLSRTGSKPVKVRIEHDDPGAHVLVEVARHISHATLLHLHVSPHYSDQILSSFRTCPAPLLETLRLAILPSENAPRRAVPVVVPQDLFASHTPRLCLVALTEMTLPQPPNFPTFLRNVTSLSYGIMSGTRHACDVPNVFELCPGLKILKLQGTVVLPDPAFWRAQNWDRLEEVDLNLVALDANALPIANVPRVIYHYYDHDAHSVQAVADGISGALSIAVHWRPNFRPSPFTLIRVSMRSTTDRVHLERRIDGLVPQAAPGTFPEDALTAFQNAPIVGRIVRLVIAVQNWDDLVGAGYLSAFPALEELVILIVHWPGVRTWRTPDPKSKLSCPLLQRLVLRKQQLSQRLAIDVSVVKSFALDGLPDARFPLKLELNDVTLVGLWEDHRDVFSCCDEREITDIDDNI
ncbi:hypothetical protein AURDEDRAFT_122264 [Auricularia subglabra TFB-10046 SS5]|nr:hypothetical protein AURDEDRAFT_122264 [Auricularia subglabra TFB-10046 SS5]